MSKFCMSCMEQYEDEYEVCPFCGYIENTSEEDALHMLPGSILHERYIVGKSIGFGGFGVTYIGYDALLEHKVAIKEYMPSEFSTRAMGESAITIFGGKKEEQFSEGMRKFHDEAKRLAKFNHADGVVKVYDSFEENNTAYIIMELLEGETLAAFLEREKTVSVERAIELVLPIAESLKTVHQSGIIHRDISPDNIFLTKDGKVKLIDFGAARFATSSHSRSLSVLIKPGYSPEEQYRSRGDQGAYTDIYALGAVLYRMITGQVPPDALERRAFFENKKKDILVPITKYCKDISEDRQNAILNAMNVRIEDRTQSAEEFIHELTTNEPVARKKGRIKALKFYTWPLWAKISIPSAAVLVVTLSILFAFGIIGFQNDIQKNIYVPDGMARVPSIINTEIDKAESRLKQAVLLYNISGKEYSAQIPANMILTQSVDGGSVVAENTIIDLVVSGGAQMAMVPNVEGMYVGEAIAALEALGFEVQTETEYSSTVAEGGVIVQSVDAEEEYPVGETIVLTVSLGRDPEQAFEAIEVTVPDFVGKTYAEAQKMAADAGLMVIAKEKSYSTEYAKDVIMGQGSAVGSTIMSGSTIELTVSLGIQKIKIPDVQFMTEAAAVALLEGSGLQVTVSQEHSETVKAGLVITQNPASGTQATSGDTVAIVVSKGASSFAMPNVVGMREEEAKSLLKGKGISVTVNYEYSTSDDVGKVLEQSVKADTQVYAGSTMTITVSTGQELFTVPDVTGKAKTEAETLLKDAGFTPKVNEVYSETAAAGTVISQSPDADSSQPKGTQILITVSLGQKPITVPDVVGKTKTVATSLLESAGFVVHVQYSYDDDVAANLVISQSPAGKKTAYSGNTVILMVSKGPQNIAPTNLLISPSASSVDVGGTVTITAVITPSNATDKTVTYKSSNTSIATVSSSGIVTGVAPGTVTITATTNTGGISASYQITVNEPTITLNYSRVECTVPTYRYVQLEATPSVSGATVTWSSSNTDAATVNSDGLVYIENAQICTITASMIVGGETYSASCELSIYPEGAYFNSDEEEITLFVGDSYMLSTHNVGQHYRYYDANGVLVDSKGDAYGQVTNSQPEVATYDDYVITAHSAGTTTLRIQAGIYYDEITVHVKVKPTLTLGFTEKTLHVGDKIDFMVTFNCGEEVDTTGISLQCYTSGTSMLGIAGSSEILWPSYASEVSYYEGLYADIPGTSTITACVKYDGYTYTDTCTITVEAAGAIHVQVDTVYGKPGETVYVPIRLRENIGVTAIEFGATIDSRLSQTTISDMVEIYEIMGSDEYIYGTFTRRVNDSNAMWVANGYGSLQTKNGILVLLAVTIPDNAQTGTYDINYESIGSSVGLPQGWLHIWSDVLNDIDYVDEGQVTWTNGAIIITE